MGGGSWTSKTWEIYAEEHITSKSTAKEVYKAKALPEKFNPRFIKLRESCDGEDNPESTAIAIALDVTGSMDRVLKATADKLGLLVSEIHQRKPVTDPHIMFMAVGDVVFDRAPLQATQFEADIRVAEQLTELYFERGGGGNKCESYNLPYFFLAKHSKIDCFEKRGQKGYLFTIGDEEPPVNLTKTQIEQVFGYTIQEDKLSTEELLTMVNRTYEVFHLMIEEGYNYTDMVKDMWLDLLGQHAILVVDHTKISEIIVSILEMVKGKDQAEIIKSWDGSTGLVVSQAIKGLVAGNEENDLVEF